MLISVLICTRNRAESLRKTLESLFIPVNVASSDWECIVVDNNSTDTTSVVCETFASRFPGKLRSFVEKRVGKSNALNTGIAAALGAIVAMTDDDVLFDSGYLAGIRSVFSEYKTDAVLGRVELDFDGARPSWFDDYFAKMMSWRNYGDKVCEFEQGITGTNFMVTAEAFRKVGGFCPDLTSTGKAACEDMEFHRRLRGAGCKVLFAPQVLVHHQIPSDRMTKEFFLTRSYINGCSAAFFSPLPSSIGRFALYAVKAVAISYLTAFGYRLAGKESQALQVRCDAIEQIGLLRQHWQFRKSGYPQLTFPSFKNTAMESDAMERPKMQVISKTLKPTPPNQSATSREAASA